ncbi:MAG TPA: hypothetical protein VGG39_26865 [Polyangiaceae bacterium]|jgi:hypothetical protein
MSSEQPKRRGRPPREEGPGVYHLGLRFNAHREEQVRRCVDAANERARAAGLPANITASGLVALWIGERLDLETAKLGRKR